MALGDLNDDGFKSVFQATWFTDPVDGNAFYYLCSLFPIIVPMWVADFRKTYALLTAGFANRITLDRAINLSREGGGRWAVETASGRAYTSQNVVLAVPYQNARDLYPVPRP